MSIVPGSSAGSTHDASGRPKIFRQIRAIFSLCATRFFVVLFLPAMGCAALPGPANQRRDQTHPRLSEVDESRSAFPIRESREVLTLLIQGKVAAQSAQIPAGLPEGRYRVLLIVDGGQLRSCRSLGQAPDLFGEAVCGIILELKLSALPDGDAEGTAIVERIPR